MENTIFGMDATFIDTLNSDELQELNNAKSIVDKYSDRYNVWSGGVSRDDIKSHLEEVALKQRQEAEACDRVRNNFR